MDNQVEEVKSRTDIATIIGERIDLKKAGRNYKALCPFHGEKTPSFMVSPELQIFKCFGCFPPGQFVKTPFGYHKIEDVAKGEYVYSGKGRLQRVELPLSRQYEGDLVTISLANLTEEVTMTGDHKVFVVGGSPLYKNNYKYLSKRLNQYSEYSLPKKISKTAEYFPIQEVIARNLKKAMTVLYPIDTTIADLDKIDLSEYITKRWPLHGKKPVIPELEVKIDSDFLKLIGYYIAEGSNHRAYIRFSIGDHEKDFADDIVNIAKKIFGIEANICRKHKTNKSGTEISLCNSVLANVFENLCGKGAQSKHIPFVFQQLPPDKQLILLNAIYRGDGCRNKLKDNVKTYRKSITTVSRTLAEQLTDILLRNELFPSRYVQKQKTDKNGVFHKDAYTVSWSENPKVAKHKHVYEDKQGNKYWLLPILKVKTSLYKGAVFNLRVAGDHSYVVNTLAVSNCGEAGDAFAFLEKYEGMDFAEALKYLADRAGVKLKKFSGESSEKERLIDINTQALRFYNYLLLSHPVGKRALEYLLKNRGLKKESIEEFKLGYSPESSYSLNKYLVGKKKFDPKEIEKAGIGIVRGRGLYDRFNGRIIFPLFDHRGNPIGFSGRVLPWDKRETGKYINSPETPLYHKSNVLYGLNQTRSLIKKKKTAIIVEGELDLISSWQAGIKNVVAIKGSALTEEQVKLLSRFAQKFILSLDSDVAGDAATRRGIKVAADLGIEIKVAELSGGYKDPDEAARGNIESYKKDLIGAKVIWDYLIDSVFARNSSETGIGKSKISKEIVPILAEIGNEIVQAHYAQVVAKRLDVPLSAVTEEITKIEKGQSQDEGNVVKKVEPRTKREILEENFLRLSFQNDPKALLEKSVKKIINLPFNLRLIEELEKFSQKKKFSVSAFGKSLPKELFEGFSKIVLSLEKEEDEVDNVDEIKKELELVEKQLKILEVKEKLEKLESQMREMEEKGESTKLLKAQKEFNILAKKRSTYEKDGGGGIILNEG